jgi:hypothetical protein
VACPVPHPNAQHSAEYLLSTYDAAIEKSGFSKIVIEILECPEMRDQLENFILGFKSKEKKNLVTRYPEHLRAFKQLYTSVMTATAADGETSGATFRLLSV